MDKGDSNAEAQRRIKICAEKGKKRLDLSDLRNMSVIPESLLCLKNLQTLLIEGNFNEIPNWIGELKQLNILSISSHCIENIPPEIGNLKKLKSLTVRNGVMRIPTSMVNCPLEELYVKGSFETLPKVFGNLKELKNLALYSDKLKSLPDSFGDLSSLEELTISSGKNLRLPESFGDLRSLRKLSFFAYKMKALPESFGNLCSLQELSLYTDSMEALPESFGKLYDLEKFYFHNNKANTLPRSFGNCKKLKTLDIKSEALTELPASFYKLKNLQTIHLDTFKLKALPLYFSRLNALEEIVIFSGTITSLPKNMGQLKNLKNIQLDTHNVQKQPIFPKNVSCVEQKYLIINKMLSVWPKSKCRYHLQRKPHGFESKFDALKNMSFKYREKILKDYSLKELDALLLSAPMEFEASDRDRAIFYDIQVERYCKMRDRFRPSKKNILRIVEVSDQFLKAWEDGFAKAKTMLEAIYEKEQDKSSFEDRYNAKIELIPKNFYRNPKTSEWEGRDYDDAFTILQDWLRTGAFDMTVSYDPATKDESDFRSRLHVSRELNWNIFIARFFKEHYLCYAIYELCSRNHWALQDIAKINDMYINIEISCEKETGEF